MFVGCRSYKVMKGRTERAWVRYATITVKAMDGTEIEQLLGIDWPAEKENWSASAFAQKFGKLKEVHQVNNHI